MLEVSANDLVTKVFAGKHKLSVSKLLHEVLPASLVKRLEELHEDPETRRYGIDDLSALTHGMTPAEAMNLMFCWRRSTEGQDYWEAFYNALVKGPNSTQRWVDNNWKPSESETSSKKQTAKPPTKTTPTSEIKTSKPGKETMKSNYSVAKLISLATIALGENVKAVAKTADVKKIRDALVKALEAVMTVPVIEDKLADCTPAVMASLQKALASVKLPTLVDLTETWEAKVAMEPSFVIDGEKATLTVKSLTLSFKYPTTVDNTKKFKVIIKELELLAEDKIPGDNDVEFLMKDFTDDNTVVMKTEDIVIKPIAQKK